MSLPSTQSPPTHPPIHLPTYLLTHSFSHPTTHLPTQHPSIIAPTHALLSHLLSIPPLSQYPSIYLSAIHLSTYPSVCLPHTLFTCLPLPIHLSIRYPPINQSTHLPILPNIHTSINLYTYPSYQTSTHQPIYPLIYLPTRSFIYPAFYPLTHCFFFFHPSIHLALHTSIYLSTFPPSLQHNPLPHSFFQLILQKRTMPHCHCLLESGVIVNVK